MTLGKFYFSDHNNNLPFKVLLSPSYDDRLKPTYELPRRNVDWDSAGLSYTVGPKRRWNILAKDNTNRDYSPTMLLREWADEYMIPGTNDLPEPGRKNNFKILLFFFFLIVSLYSSSNKKLKYNGYAAHVFAAIGLNWLATIWGVMRMYPIILKQPLDKTFEAISKLVPWFSVATPPLMLAFDQAAKSKLTKPETISFDDLIGMKDAKASLKWFVNILKGEPSLASPREEYHVRGVLLCGPEYTGKETIANALAHDAKVNFFSILAQDIVGAGASEGVNMIKRLFAEARMYSPCVIYVRDVDLIAKSTTGSDPIGVQLLLEMEKCNKDGHIMLVIIGTTKKPETLDANLRNSQLFSKEVRMEKPDENAREKFVDLKLDGMTTEDDREKIFKLIVSETRSLTRNDINRVCNIAIQNANERGGKSVTMEDATKAIDTVKSSIAAYNDK